MHIDNFNIEKHIIFNKRDYLSYRPYKQDFFKINLKESFFNNQYNTEFKNEFNDKFIDLTSNNKKVLIAIHPAFFHIFIDNLTSILKINEKFPNIEFILEVGDLPTNQDGSWKQEYVVFFFKILSDKKINFNIINSLKNKSFLLIDNYYTVEELFFSNKTVELLSDIFSEYVIDKEIAAHKKVYLSRQKTTTTTAKRIDDESLMADYFFNKGFEIVYAEDFKTFEEQINYFYSVKTLVAFTGSGFINMLSMQKKSNILEIYTPISGTFYDPYTKTSTKKNSLHTFYRDLSFVKNNLHFSISNYDFNAKTVIKNLENFATLDKFIYE